MSQPVANASLLLSDVPAQLSVGQTTQMTATYVIEAGASLDVTASATWSSSNDAIFTVSKGLVTGVGMGSAEITAVYQASLDRKIVAVAPPAGQELQFRVAILSGERVPSAEVDVRRVFAVAQGLMRTKTGVPMVLVDYVTVGSGVPAALASTYLAAHASAPPDGVLVLSDDTNATTFGGYSVTVTLPSPWLNRYSSPFLAPNRAYVAVVDFDHYYARCGYTAELEHVSATSFGGECRNVTGLQCTLTNGKYWTCPNASADLYAQPDIFPASTFVHEFSHPFGPAGNNDHYGTPTCVSRTGMSTADAANLVLAQQNYGMCPDVYRNFKK
jgi:hypothetical protein